VGALGLVWAAVSAGPAAASGPCGSAGVLSRSGPTLTCTYTTVGEDSFSVPSGIPSVSVTAVGGPGGDGAPPFSGGAQGGSGGLGALVTVPDLGLSGHPTLYVEVGGAGGPGQTGPSAPGCPGGAGGSNGGGAGGQGRCTLGGGGGGGGESDIRTAPTAMDGLNGGAGDPRLVVAGGGGGGGGAVFGGRNGGAGGAAGGSAATGAGAGGSVDCATFTGLGSPGAPGQTGPPAGAGGSDTHPRFCLIPAQSGGDGVVPTGGAGGNGDAGNTAGGGGGGAGYYGGGGGGAVAPFGGSGGGGGSSFGPSDAAFQTASASQSPEIVISWTESPSVSISAPANGELFSQGQVVTSSFTCSDLGGPGISSCTDQNGKSSGATLDTSTVGQHMFTVAATSSDGLTASASTTYAVVAKPPPNVPPPPSCPAAGGRHSGQKLGAMRLGMTRKRARSVFSHHSSRGRRYLDFFCLTPIGVRVGYASPKLLGALPPGERDRFRGRVVWISTSNPRYAIGGVRAGARLASARRRLRLERVLPIGLNDWYFAPAGPVTAVLKVRHGVVQEVGIAVRALTSDRRAELIFMTSFW
jgi:hypothetical protein